MESDLGAFDQGYEEEIDHFLKAMEIVRLPASATADNAGAGRNKDVTVCAPNLSAGGNDTAVKADVIGAQEAVTRSAETPWLGTDVSAASTLVVLVTAVCRRVLCALSDMLTHVAIKCTVCGERRS